VSTSGIGASVKRREDVRLLTGCGRFADDCDAPGQVHAAFVRSPHAHADVLAIEAGPARAVAGVLGVFTGRDLAADGVGPIPTGIAERAGAIRSRDGSPFAEPPWHPLALDRARHVGEPVALVVAATPVDLGHLIAVRKPVVRARYEFAEADEPGLGALVDAWLARTHPAR